MSKGRRPRASGPQISLLARSLLTPRSLPARFPIPRGPFVAPKAPQGPPKDPQSPPKDPQGPPKAPPKVPKTLQGPPKDPPMTPKSRVYNKHNGFSSFW